jgi:outer membrane protein OmpA-like peptidoglycan-associated protein
MMDRLLLLLLLLAMISVGLAQTQEPPEGKHERALATVRVYAGSPAGMTDERSGTQYAVKPVPFNTPGMEFSPYPYKKGMIFVSTRNEKSLAPEAFLSLFYTEESDDGDFSIPQPLHQGTITSYHEGPAVFFNDGTKKIFTRNSMMRKSKMKDGSENPLELAQSEITPSGKWTEPVTLPFASAGYSVAHPAISSDGTTLYFSSNMPGTVGQSDIFVSKLNNGTWSEPRNLGTRINTPGNELFPFLFNDSILFFASNGHRGHGGLDIFSCNLNTPDPRVSNFGSPVNGKADDFGIFLEGHGNAGFFSSNREGGAGADDLYYFEVVQPFISFRLLDSLTGRPINNARLALRSSTWTGETHTDFTGKAECRINPLSTYRIDVTVDRYKTAVIDFSPLERPAGKHTAIDIYLVPLTRSTRQNHPTTLQTRSREGLSNTIIFDSSPLDVDLAQQPAQPGDTSTSLTVDSLLLPKLNIIAVEVVNDLPTVIMTGSNSLFEFTREGERLFLDSDPGLHITIPRGARRNDYEQIISDELLSQGYGIGRFLLIRSFFFDTGKTWVRNDASAQLDKIAELMNAYPQMDLQMIFHSDSRGSDSFNLDLSKARSVEVTGYLLSAGIKKERIYSTYVGESQPLKDCGDLSDCDELFHQMNRTVEFKFEIKQF